MAKKVINGFEFEEEQSLEDTLKQHYEFSKKQILDKKDKEYQETLKNEKIKWETEKAQETFLGTFKDDSQEKKIVSKLLLSGTSIEDIKKEFSNLLPKENTPMTDTPIKKIVSVGDILQDLSQASEDKDLEELSKKDPNTWTEDEEQKVIKYRASKK